MPISKGGFSALITFALAISSAACDPPAKPPEGLAGFPGQDAAATKSYLASLDFSVQDSVFDGWLPCEEPARCGNSDSVHIRIVPEARAHVVPIGKAMAQGNGHVVAMIRNLEDKPFHPYGLDSGDTAYLWVGSLEGGGRRMAIFRIGESDGQSKLLATATEAGWCGRMSAGRKVAAVHVNPNGMCNDSSFYSSPRQSASITRLASATSSRELAFAAATAAFSHARGLWFSCSLGCCEARGFQEEM